MLSHVLQFFAALIVFVCIHEMGHVIAARICGYRHARFHLVQIKDGKVTLAVTDAPLHLFSDRQNIWISMAGVLGTRFCAEVMLLGTQVFSGEKTSWMATFWISLFLLLRTDLFLYTLRNILGRYLLRTPQGDQDISLAAMFLEKTTGRPEHFWFVLLGGLALLELCLGLPRMMDAVLSRLT
ncbi:M50 family metallopeptidase [Deinococcus cellulosilyticus]|uniref:Peptidase M50 n=1 Tax=Deinococcus cellulosilyticus (strain DSM 18568 / NBRC 106333 / KACC 11606 / 5516J-15) TaxID=1223518 RepID=A0A511N7I2_DEIC1|nr:M50 family metallopeptidase [Deinococcus cellulosilyticus]GEM48794.1 hypothetical protein DC3_44290 [Deinococcus cellulosilyticus NBRC 106333 = KACC 11606]